MSLRFIVSQLKENGQLRAIATVEIQEDAEAVVRRFLSSDPAIYWISDTELGLTQTVRPPAIFATQDAD